MTTVQGKLIGLADPARVQVTATLVDLAGERALGYVAAVPGEIVGTATATPDGTGTWSLDLTPNADIVADAGDTAWSITEGRALDGTPNVTYVVVPATGGPLWIGGLRIALSGTALGTGTIVYVPGPAGPQGATGAAGATGPAGSAGATGEQGPAGQTGLPSCQVLVMGCWAPTGSPGASITNTDATLRTAAASAGYPFVSPVTGSVYDATGALVAVQGAWVTSGNVVGYVGADAVHPTDSGHVYLARRIVAAWREALPA